MTTQSKIIVPLDGMNEARSLELADELSGLVWGFKVNDLLLESGLSIVTKLKARGNVFADPKLHDIPNTVANGVHRLADAGADLITIHASGGQRMIEAAVEVAGSAKILSVTALTSLTDEETTSVYGLDSRAAVSRLASLAAASGSHGIVCSPKELDLLQADEALKKLYKVVPGIRPSWYGTKDDQRRVLEPRDAIAAGADLLVIGRPITASDDSRAAVERINSELSN